METTTFRIIFNPPIYSRLIYTRISFLTKGFQGCLENTTQYFKTLKKWEIIKSRYNDEIFCIKVHIYFTKIIYFDFGEQNFGKQF